MIAARWVLGVLLAGAWLGIAAANASIVWRAVVRKDGTRSSLITVTGGLLALLAVAVCPWHSPLKWIALPVALLLDVGSVPYVVVFVFLALRDALARLVRRERAPGPSHFPSFERLFVPQPLYVPLLHLGGGNVDAIFTSIAEACRRSPHPREEIGALLSDPNWRAHLVGAVATAVCPPDQRPLQALWAAVDGTSWVSPQLLVVAYFCDEHFVETARDRIERCRDAKTLAALIALCGLIPSCRESLAEQTAREDVRTTLAADVDDAAGITTRWKSKLEEHCRRLGRSLAGPA